MLERVSRHDPVFLSDRALLTQQHDYNHPSQDYELHRPRTADLQDPSTQQSDHRPFTSVSIPPELDPTTSTSTDPLSSLTGSLVRVALVGNWGDPSHLGLTSITLLEAGSRQPVALRPDQLTLSLPGTGGMGTRSGGREGVTGYDNVGKLVDGINVTNDGTHMWACLLPCLSEGFVVDYPTLTFALDTPTPLMGLRVWNYNLSMEDSYKGVMLDGPFN